MNKDDYALAVRMCYAAAQAIAVCELPDVLSAISMADTLGPIMDPSLWMKKQGAMQEDRELVEAAMPLWRLAQKLKAAAP